MRAAADKYWDRIAHVAANYMDVTNRRMDSAKSADERFNIVFGKIQSSMKTNAWKYSETFRKAIETLG